MTHSARWDHGQALARLARSACFEQRDLGACLRALTECAVSTLGLTQCGAWFYSEEGDSLTCTNLFRGDSASHADGMILRASRFPAWFAALREARVVAVEDVATDPRTLELVARKAITGLSGARLDAPLIYRGKLVGVLSCEHVSAARQWRADEEAFVASLADLVATAMALEEARRSDEWRQDADRRYRDLFDSATEGIFQMTAAGRFFSVNPAMAKLLGYPSAEALIVGHRKDAASWFVSPRHWEELSLLVQTTGRVIDHEVEAVRADGSKLWVSLNVRAVRRSDGSLRYFQGIVEDVTQRKRTEAQLTHIAFHDGLTNLANRALLGDRIEQALRRARAGKAAGTGLMIVDLDDFQLINNSLGYAVGDRMLVEIAGRLSDAVRPGDTVSRMGSDDFAVLTEGVTDGDELLALADIVGRQVSQPIPLGQQEIFPSVSIGIVWDSGERGQSEEIMRDAGIALQQARALGRGRSVLFQEQMRQAASEALWLQTELHRAIERGELELRYQPVVGLVDQRLTGFEALVRWHHPDRGSIPPVTFIPIAEQHGLMAELGQWILRTACERLRRWQQTAPLSAPSLSVNVSPVELLAPDLLESVDRTVASTGVDIRGLKLEITETALAEDLDLVSGRLSALHQRGFKILIDDFGTGYSSLSRLHRFPIDGLKIDQSFVKPMLYDKDSASIVRTVVALGRALDVDIIAEGVEDEATAMALSRLSCTQAQGYHFAKPLTAEEADRLVARMAGHGSARLPISA